MNTIEKAASWAENTATLQTSHERDALNFSQAEQECNSFVRTVKVSAVDVARVKPFVEQRVKGPRPRPTNARRTSAERDATFAQDIATGMIGEASLYMLLHGELLGLSLYLAQRTVMSHYPLARADGGSDVAGLNIDLKTSYWRSRNLRPEEHHLPVPLAFFRQPGHASRVYALAVAEELESGGWLVRHVGWIPGRFIEAIEDPRFSGSAAVPGTQLWHWPPLDWRFAGGVA